MIRLGILHLLFKVLIFFYVVVVVVLVNQGYLKKEAPLGSVRTQSMEAANPNNVLCPGKWGTGWRDWKTLPYCTQYDGKGTVTQYPCENWGPMRTIVPSAENDALLVTTRNSAIMQTCAGTECSHGNYTWGAKKGIFTADIERYSVWMHQVVVGPSTGITYTDADMGGRLVGVDGSVIREWKGSTDTAFADPEFICFGDFLKAAGIDLDDVNEMTAKGPDQETWRSSGLVLMVFIEVSNLGQYFCSPCQASFTMTVAHVKDAEFKIEDATWLEYPTSRYFNSRHGVRLIFKHTGQLGAFSFQVMLIQLVTSMGLLAVATTIVDLVALQLLPEKKHYNDYKYEFTEDFSDLRDGLLDLDERPRRRAQLELDSASRYRAIE